MGEDPGEAPLGRRNSSLVVLSLGKGRTPLPQALGYAVVWLRSGKKGWDNEDLTPLTWDLKTTNYIKTQNQVVLQGMVRGRSLEVRELFFFPWSW